MCIAVLDMPSRLFAQSAIYHTNTLSGQVDLFKYDLVDLYHVDQFLIHVIITLGH